MDVANLKFLLVGCLFFAACGDKTTEEEENNNTSTTNNTTPTPQPQRWTTGVIEGGNMGLHPRVAVAPDGTIGAAWMAIEGREDGPCTELGEDPPIQVRWKVRYGTFNGTQWVAEDVADLRFVGQPPGIDLAFDGNSQPILAGMAGDPVVQFRYCGVNDAAIYTRSGQGNWSAETAVQESGEAATGDAASDFGTVIGYWPALAIAANGDIGLAYKDVHAGGIQSDDFRRADLEFAWRRGNSWSPYAVDFGRGGGNFTKMIFDLNNRPIIMHYNPTEDNTGTMAGIWLHRSTDGAEWDRVQIHNQPTFAGPTLAIDPNNGTLWTAFYNSQLGYPVVGRLEDPTLFTNTNEGWSFEDVGDSRYDEGYGTSIAVNKSGIVGLAYYRCARATAGLSQCNPSDDALIFAYYDGFSWTLEEVELEGDGQCGNAPSLAFDANDRPIIVYRCEDTVDGRLDTQLRFARRSTAP
jgi:hypothetical protein